MQAFKYSFCSLNICSDIMITAWSFILVLLPVAPLDLFAKPVGVYIDSNMKTGILSE